MNVELWSRKPQSCVWRPYKDGKWRPCMDGTYEITTHIGVLCYITPTPSVNKCKKYWNPFLLTPAVRLLDRYDTWQVRTVTKEPETESWKYGNTSNPYLTVTFCKIIITHWAFELTLFITIFFRPSLRWWSSLYFKQYAWTCSIMWSQKNRSM